jgi:hypothetical protein
METSSHILWHAINEHEEKKIIIVKTFEGKGPRILFGQFLFVDCPLKVFLVGPPDHTFTMVDGTKRCPSHVTPRYSLSCPTL